MGGKWISFSRKLHLFSYDSEWEKFTIKEKTKNERGNDSKQYLLRIGYEKIAKIADGINNQC